MEFGKQIRLRSLFPPRPASGPPGAKHQLPRRKPVPAGSPLATHQAHGVSHLWQVYLALGPSAKVLGPLFPASELSPHKRRNKSVGHWRIWTVLSCYQEVAHVTGRAHRGGLPPRAQSSRLSVNHQPARGPVRRTTPRLRATAALPPGLHPWFPPTSFLTSSRAPVGGQQPLSAHGCGYRYGRGPGRPPANLAPWAPAQARGWQSRFLLPARFLHVHKNRFFCERKKTKS